MDEKFATMLVKEAEKSFEAIQYFMIHEIIFPSIIM